MWLLIHSLFFNYTLLVKRVWGWVRENHVEATSPENSYWLPFSSFNFFCVKHVLVKLSKTMFWSYIFLFYLGMMFVGCILRNVPSLNVAKDIDTSLASALRWVQWTFMKAHPLGRMYFYPFPLSMFQLLSHFIASWHFSCKYLDKVIHLINDNPVSHFFVVISKIYFDFIGIWVYSYEKLSCVHYVCLIWCVNNISQ